MTLSELVMVHYSCDDGDDNGNDDDGVSRKN
jgi:hypothetical protein